MTADEMFQRLEYRRMHDDFGIKYRKLRSEKCIRITMAGVCFYREFDEDREIKPRILTKDEIRAVAKLLDEMEAGK